MFLSLGQSPPGFLPWLTQQLHKMSFGLWPSPDPVDKLKVDTFSVLLQRAQTLELPSETSYAAAAILSVAAFSLIALWLLKRVLKKTRATPRTRAITPETESTAESYPSSHFIREEGRLVRRSPRSASNSFGLLEWGVFRIAMKAQTPMVRLTGTGVGTCVCVSRSALRRLHLAEVPGRNRRFPSCNIHVGSVLVLVTECVCSGFSLTVITFACQTAICQVSKYFPVWRFNSKAKCRSGEGEILD